MLCDQIANNGFIEPHIPSLDKEFIDKIRAAQKFVLAPDFAQVADELTLRLDNIAKAIDFNRLPYPLCWIEVAQHDRPSFVQGVSHEWQSKPTRIGYLLEATRDDLSAWKAHLLWNIEGSGCVACVTAGAFDMRGEPVSLDIIMADAKKGGNVIGNKLIPLAPHWRNASPQIKARIAGTFAPAAPDYGLPIDVMRMMKQHGNIEVARFLTQIAYADWAGETHYLNAVLAMLNARNVSERFKVDNVEYNKKRLARGKEPLFSHHVLTIHARQKERMAPRNPREGEHAEARRHFVTGHWKVRKTGVFFWLPFMRGSAAAGEVSKDYRVDA